MYIDSKVLLAQTDGGLKIILHYYPQAAPCVENSRRKFKLRESEKTPSATLHYVKKDGVWVVTDFGGDAKPQNGIEVCRNEEGLTFKEALDVLAQRYGITGENTTPEILKPEISKRDATPEEEEGKWFFVTRKGFTELDVRTVVAENAIPYQQSADGKTIDFEKVEKVFLRYNFYSLESYSIVKNREVITIAATDRYPIFMWHEPSFKKIYQPLSPDKSRRFMYYGERPKDFLHGLAACHAAYETNFPKDVEEKLDPESGEKIKPTPVKLPEILYCSGGSDGMNAALIGYQVVWGNSETAKLTGVQMKKLGKITERVMNLPDIDETGLKEAHRLALEHLELFTVELPEQLRAMPDKRGNPSKDFRDFLRHFRPYDFKQLVDTALPYQFWEKFWSKDQKTGKYKTSYDVRNTRMYNFLRKNGFGRIELQNEKTGYIYIQLVHNLVRQIKANEVKNYINKFLETRGMDEILRDTFYRSNQVNESSMSNLPIVEIDFTDYDQSSQYFFFDNGTVHVTPTEIKQYKPGEIKRYVWEDEIITHRIKLEDPYFEITARPDGSLDITILRHDCDWLNYLINTCRMHWRKEMEESLDGKSQEEKEAYLKAHKFDIAGPNLDPLEQQEQKQHLINRLYAAGYLLHGYKDPSRPWCVFGMDNRVGDDGESHGGSGKSLFFKSIRRFMKSVTLDGRKSKLTEDQFIYENVSRHTGYILIDDANQYLDFQFFFSALTGELTVNPKHGTRFEIPFEEVPKFGISSNFVVRNLDSSTARRLIYTVFSDYYHANQPGHDYYREDRTVKDDFGYNLLTHDFPSEQLNRFYNLKLQCTKLYLNHDKISPPMNNVEIRHLKSEMGENFLEWADVYFSDESERLNCMVPRIPAFENFKSTTNSRLWSAQKFLKSVAAWCRYNGYVLDPKEFQNAKGRIIRKEANEAGVKVATEMIYIRTQKDVSDDIQPPGAEYRSGDIITVSGGVPKSPDQKSIWDNLDDDTLKDQF